MNEEKKREWVWVVIEEDPKGDTLLGQVDTEQGERFIPFFDTKEEGLECLHAFKKGTSAKRIVQAMHYEDLLAHARENGFALFNLDGAGRILEKIREGV